MKNFDEYFVDGILKYQKHTLNIFNILEPIEGKRILEVGGNHDFAVAYSLNNISKEKVFVINIDKEIKLISNDKVEVLNEDGCKTTFGNNSFDVIVGIAVLEHIIDMELFAKEMFRILTPNGRLYLQGGPIWTSGCGHHISVTNEKMDYHFVRNNPIEEFDHLLLNKDQLKLKLISKKNITPDHADKIIEFIYHRTDCLNRFSPSEIIKPFLSLPFKDIKIKSDLQEVAITKNLTDENKINNIYIHAKK